MGTKKRRLDPRLVERVARAMFKVDGWAPELWLKVHADMRRYFRRQARAAIRVIRGR